MYDFKFTRHARGYTAVQAGTGRRLIVEKRGKRWIAWDRGQQATPPMRTRLGACLVHVDPIRNPAANG